MVKQWLRGPDEDVKQKTQASQPEPSGEREIRIKVNPHKLGKAALLVLLLVGIFLLGRFSADPDIGIQGLFTGVDELEEAVEEVEEEPKKEEVKAEPVKKEEPKVEEKPKEKPKKEESKSEKVITKDYSSVKVEVSKPSFKWMETWGRLEKITFTITNGEDGTIKPSYAIMVIKGYDYEKNIPMPGGLQEIRSGKGLETAVTIPGGFPYSDSQAGVDVTAVQVTVDLYDEKANLMDTFTGSFNLQG